MTCTPTDPLRFLRKIGPSMVRELLFAGAFAEPLQTLARDYLEQEDRARARMISTAGVVVASIAALGAVVSALAAAHVLGR